MSRKESSRKEQPEAAATTFEHALAELEQLVQQMERGDLSLDDSLKAYERGIALYRHCQTALEQAELKVRQLSDPLDPASAKPFDESA